MQRTTKITGFEKYEAEIIKFSLQQKSLEKFNKNQVSNSLFLPF